MHTGYEALEPYPLNEVPSGLSMDQDDYARYAVKKMKYSGKAGAWDKTRITYNSQIAIEGIPEEAHRYKLGSGSCPGLDPGALPGQDGQGLRDRERPGTTGHVSTSSPVASST
ncbi:type ISP restriction/modification enzyme [Arthrobacter sp. W4I7]|uniref:type ISP restriction/modification enzyme n=1 Tax=Arthrobacter sp. W4I7 TaxID=3042296 RepID=UPI0027D7BCED|nr:type ISP restriction/modification enzyme [Arthrobacter sp. W4I7]